MKILYKLSCVLSLALTVSACSLDADLEQNRDSASAYESVQDVENGTIGAYYALGHYGFLGNYAIAYGDVCGGLTNGSASSGHFYYQTYWSITDTDEEMEYVWFYGFKVIDSAVRTINGANHVLETNTKLTDENKNTLYYNISQCYALRALAYFTMTNYFCMPYNKGTEAKGLPLVKDQPVEAFQTLTRATIGETYDFICEDIEKALQYNEESGIASLQYFYMNKAAIYALKARVMLYMGKYDEAETAAKMAISLKFKGEGKYNDLTPSNEAYVNMWASNSVTDEDIFTICKTEADNLSANALNTLYGSYDAKVSKYCKSFFNSTDVRSSLIGIVDKNSGSCMKYQGLESAQAVSNIPIFRKSEMALIVAECEARKGNLDEAREYVGYTAKRDSEYTDEEGFCNLDLLPDTQEKLLEFIWEENTREFFGEGHFYAEARRLDKTITVMDGMCDTFKPANFVFPIPAAEINAGFLKDQNEGWEDNLPE